MNQLPSAGGTILAVDDTPANLRLLIELLSAQGYKVRPAPSGPLALKALESSLPDLILLDVMMPEMDGYQVCERLKQDERTRAIPVLFISALDDTFNKVRAFSAGAVDYITKPFQAEEVLARIHTHLTLYRLQRQQRELFQRFATREVVDMLLANGFSLGGQTVDASVLFADIRSFTTIAEAQPPAETIELLNQYFGYMISVIGGEGGIVSDIAGDGLLCLFGAPVPYPDHSQRAVQAALKMLNQIKLLNASRAGAGKAPLNIGIGIASGPVIAGYVGTEVRATYTCVGDTVNTAARLETYTKELGQPILISEATRAALNDQIGLQDHGFIQLKGKTRQVRVFSVFELLNRN